MKTKTNKTGNKLKFFRISAILFWIITFATLAYYLNFSAGIWLAGNVYEHPVDLKMFLLALCALVLFIILSIAIDRVIFSDSQSTTGLIIRVSLLIVGYITLCMAYLSTELQYQKRFHTVNSQYAELAPDQRIDSNLEYKTKQILHYYYSDINSYYTAPAINNKKYIKNAYSFNQQYISYVLLFFALTCFANYTYLILAYRNKQKIERLTLDGDQAKQSENVRETDKLTKKASTMGLDASSDTTSDAETVKADTSDLLIGDKLNK